MQPPCLVLLPALRGFMLINALFELGMAANRAPGHMYPSRALLHNLSPNERKLVVIVVGH